MKAKQALLLSFILIAGSLPAWAGSPIGNLTWARPIALGNAGIADAGDPSQLFSSSAAFTELAKNSYTSVYSSQGNDISLTALGGVFPKIFQGALGVGYRNRIAGGFPVSGETVDFYDHDLVLSYARQLRPNLSVGLDLRYLLRGASKPVPGYQNGQGGALGLSLKYQPNRWLALAAAVQDLGLQINYTSGAPDQYDANLVIGSAFNLIGEEGYFTNLHQSVKINLDLSQANGEPILGHLGVEWWPVKFAAARCGLNQTPNNNNFSAGIGLKRAGITFDYALYRSELLGETRHYFSIGYLGEELASPEAAQPLTLKHFPDVPIDYWAREPIEALTTVGILNWYPDGTFRPEQPVTRAEAVNLLVAAKDYPSPKEKVQVFPDVPLTFWAAGAIQTAYENKLTIGYPNGDFKPRSNTTRAEGVTFLTRWEKLDLPAARRPPFEDVKLDHWAVREVLAAQADGILRFLEEQPFQPSQSLTRAELAEVLCRTRSVNDKIKRAGLAD